jgi:hypothetical protein
VPLMRCRSKGETDRWNAPMSLRRAIFEYASFLAAWREPEHEEQLPLTASALTPSPPRTLSRQCSDYSMGCPSAGAMAIRRGGRPARVKCGARPKEVVSDWAAREAPGWRRVTEWTCVAARW